MSIIKKLLRKTLDISGLRGLNVLRNSEYLKSTGWFNSCKKKMLLIHPVTQSHGCLIR
ncbi:MAG: hypothetical protein PHZ28_06190 [Candidatus Izemoplasmatales bacterium]|nr:hypothetical protein [Candidatus Izemoplasmatales bacterium]